MKKKLLVALAVAMFMFMLTAVAAFADTTSTGAGAAIEAAGASLASEFSAMVTAVIPLIITIALTGLGVYGVIILFGFAKRLFAKATG
jgi:hypothetical protein